MEPRGSVSAATEVRCTHAHACPSTIRDGFRSRAEGRGHGGAGTVTTVRRVRQALLGTLAGAAWGGLAWLLGGAAFGPPIWGGVLASPLIGMLVGAAFQPRFDRNAGIRRALVALASLYAGGALFGLCIGAGELLLRAGGRAPLELLTEPVAAVLWGVTVGFVLARWPLAYLTHALIAWRMA